MEIKTVVLITKFKGEVALKQLSGFCMHIFRILFPITNLFLVFCALCCCYCVAFCMWIVQMLL